MNMKTFKKIGVLLCAMSATPIMAQQTYEELEQLTVNENVTTVITASEPIRFVDISTDHVVGDQPINNTIRLKPKEGADVHEDGDIIAIVTVVTERYRSQYALIYTTRLTEAVTDKQIQPEERIPFHNPSVTMSTEDMTQFARKIWNSPARIRNVATKQHRMTMRLNNIYSIGEYFFLDFSIENRTNIRFDIEEIRVKLCDKKQSKATNVQMIELTPAMILDESKRFSKGYRNVIVLKKMTFPNDKILSIEISEKQISGRNITLNIDYEDVLYADSFHSTLLQED
jgi:conjugative transposon TraN protein